MTPRFFKTHAAFRDWLERFGEHEAELLVGFHKKGSGKPSITWPESVDAALCFGWIDGVRRSLGEESYTIRFTPRRPRSIWSAINIKRVAELTKAGLMRPPGQRAFEKRSDDRSAIYSYEQRRTAKLGPEYEGQLRARPKAWAFLQSQPPGYRRLVAWWILSAKREETRSRRLATLIAECERGQRLAPLRRPTKTR